MPIKHQTAILSARSLILQILLDGPATGTELKKLVPERTDGKMQLLSGSVYPALTALKEQGWATEDEIFSRFELTAEGKALAEEERASILQLLGKRTRGPRKVTIPESETPRSNPKAAPATASSFWNS